MKNLKLKNNGELSVEVLEDIRGTRVDTLVRLSVKRGSIQAQVDLTEAEVAELFKEVAEYVTFK